MSRLFTALACFALAFACVGCAPKAKPVKKKPASEDQATPKKGEGKDGLPPGADPTKPLNPTTPAKPPGAGF